VEWKLRRKDVLLSGLVGGLAYAEFALYLAPINWELRIGLAVLPALGAALVYAWEARKPKPLDRNSIIVGLLGAVVKSVYSTHRTAQHRCAVYIWDGPRRTLSNQYSANMVGAVDEFHSYGPDEGVVGQCFVSRRGVALDLTLKGLDELGHDVTKKPVPPTVRSMVALPILSPVAALGLQRGDPLGVLYVDSDLPFSVFSGPRNVHITALQLYLPLLATLHQQAE
jgi:hypothetical protein